MTALQKYLPGNIKLTQEKLLVYLIDLRLFDEAALLPVLAEDERERAERFKVKDKREQFVITRALLREMISLSLVDTKPEAIYFSYGEHGKPAVNHTHMGKQIEFNVSHSGHYALVGLTVINKIGVDIEEIASTVDVKGLAKRYFSPPEFNNLQELPANEQFDAFYRCWTRKEAFLKGDGRGVSLGLSKFNVPMDEKINGAEIGIDTSVDISDKWYCYQPVTVPGYQTAIAANSAKLTMTAHVITN